MTLTKKKRMFLIDAAGIAVINIALRFVAVSFNAYLSAKMGAEAMGLFTLTMSVYGFVVTLATSGVNLAAVRLTAERFACIDSSGTGRREGRRCIGRVTGSCVAYSLLFSIPTGTLLYFLSPFIGEYLLGDIRCTVSLKALALSLPAISSTSALSGYFTGMRKTHKNAISAVSEQFMKIALTAGALALSVPAAMDRVEYACLAIVGSSAFAEGFSLLLNGIMFLFDSRAPMGRKYRNGKGKSVLPNTGISDVAAVALPVAIGAYVRQGLTAAEHIAIPRGLRKSGSGQTAALASYGVLHGMVFPLVLFPSAIVSSAAGLLVPELAEFRAGGDRERIKNTVNTVFTSTVLFSVCCASVFFFFGDALGMSVYGSAEAGRRIMAVSPLVPVMFFDMAVDCMLKGLGEQVHSMRINIIDSASSLLLVLILVPPFGIDGYIFSVFFCETLNCILSVIRLKKITGVGIELFRILPPLCFAVCSGFLSKLAVGRYTLAEPAPGIMLTVAIYGALTVIFRCLKKKEKKRAAAVGKAS